MKPVYLSNTGEFVILPTNENLQSATEAESSIIRWNEELQQYEQLFWNYERNDQDSYDITDVKWEKIT